MNIMRNAMPALLCGLMLNNLSASMRWISLTSAKQTFDREERGICRFRLTANNL